MTTTLEDILQEPNAAQAVEEAKNLAADIELAEDPARITVQIGIKGEEVKDIGPELGELICHMITMLASNQDVRLVSVPRELTTTMAAEQLGISRPTLMKLIHEGEIPAHKVRSHTRLCTKDVEAYRRKQLQQQWDAFNKLRDVEHKMGL